MCYIFLYIYIKLSSQICIINSNYMDFAIYKHRGCYFKLVVNKFISRWRYEIWIESVKLVNISIDTWWQDRRYIFHENVLMQVGKYNLL